MESLSISQRQDRLRPSNVDAIAHLAMGAEESNRTSNIQWNVPGSAGFPQRKIQLTRYIADRTGILAISNLPVLWLFAAHNDPLLWLTGWSFATYNRFHRWVSRIATVQAVVHSVAYSVYAVFYGTFQESWKERYWWTGEVATIVMCFILCASVYGMRRYHYDLFLVIHVVLAIIFLVTLFFHIKVYGNIHYNEWNAFIWPCLAIWSLDRVLRLIRIIYVSLLPRLLNGTKAIATYDDRTQMIRLDVTNFPLGGEPRPGIFYFIYAPGTLQGYESHPMTLCTWQRQSTSSSVASSRSSQEGDKSSTSPLRVASAQDEYHDMSHTFLIRPYEGFTSRLKSQISKALEARSSCQVTILLEGPYGNTLDLSRFSDVLIIAGGSDIVAAVSHTHRLMRQGSTSVRIVWAVRQRELVEDVSEHELGAVIRDDRVSMDVYLTGGDLAGPNVPETHSTYTVNYGRPQLYEVIANAKKNCVQDLAVVESGIPALSDACRKSFLQVLARPGPNIEFFSETMTW